MLEYYQKHAEKKRATMHIPRKPGEQIEVDWAGDPAYVVDRVTGGRLEFCVNGYNYH